MADQIRSDQMCLDQIWGVIEAAISALKHGISLNQDSLYQDLSVLLIISHPMLKLSRSPSSKTSPFSRKVDICLFTYLILTINMNFASVKNFLKQFCTSGCSSMVQIHIQFRFHLKMKIKISNTKPTTTLSKYVYT